MAKKSQKTSVSYSYKKLNYLYNIQDNYTAGIILEGWEAKALSTYDGDINTAYCGFDKNGLFCLFNSKIKPAHNHILNDTLDKKIVQPRQLLLNKYELSRIKDAIKIKGTTSVPAKLYRSDNGLWKLDLVIVTGKNNHDKRETIKQRDLDREMRRID